MLPFIFLSNTHSCLLVHVQLQLCPPTKHPSTCLVGPCRAPRPLPLTPSLTSFCSAVEKPIGEQSSSSSCCCLLPRVSSGVPCLQMEHPHLQAVDDLHLLTQSRSFLLFIVLTARLHHLPSASAGRLRAVLCPTHYVNNLAWIQFFFCHLVVFQIQVTLVSTSSLVGVYERLTACRLSSAL